MSDVQVQTLVGGPVALECDFLGSNPLPVVFWYINGTAMEEDRLNNTLLYLEGGRYLYLQELTTAQRMIPYHCSVFVDNVHRGNIIEIRAPTTYRLDTDIMSVGLHVYKELGTQTGRVGDRIRFVYVAGNRNTAGSFEMFQISCSSNPLVTLIVGNRYVITATLTSEAENETRVTFTCTLSGSSLNTEIMGSIMVSS